MTTEQEPRISEAASAAEWTKMAARVMEDITRSEVASIRSEPYCIGQNRG